RRIRASNKPDSGTGSASCRRAFSPTTAAQSRRRQKPTSCCGPRRRCSIASSFTSTQPWHSLHRARRQLPREQAGRSIAWPVIIASFGIGPGFLRWGAAAKVMQLERFYPRLHVADGSGSAARPTVQQMDVATVVKASQAVSSEIELPKLIETLMKIALQNAGADRGLLILSRDDDFSIEAEGHSKGGEFAVVMQHRGLSTPHCPETLVRYAIRSQKPLIIDDATRPDPLYSGDYLHHRHP